MELFNLAVDVGLINKGGAWYTFTTVPDSPKFQGGEKAREYLIQNQEIYKNLLTQIKEALGL